MTQPPPVELLRRLLSYDPETGMLTWRDRDRNLTGREAGGIDRSMGYRRVRVLGRQHLAHRIIIAMQMGEWPSFEVDHINGDRADNRLCNLRLVTRAENMRNKARYATNRSGVAGVYWHRQHRKWCASIRQDGRAVVLGVFRSLDTAVAARKAAQASSRYHPNHGREARRAA